MHNLLQICYNVFLKHYDLNQYMTHNGGQKFLLGFNTKTAILKNIEPCYWFPSRHKVKKKSLNRKENEECQRYEALPNLYRPVLLTVTPSQQSVNFAFWQFYVGVQYSLYVRVKVNVYKCKNMYFKFKHFSTLANY